MSATSSVTSSPDKRIDTPWCFAKIHQVWEFSARALHLLIAAIKRLIEQFFASFRPFPKEKLPPLRPSPKQTLPLPPQKKPQPEPPPTLLQVPVAPPPPQTPSPPAPQTNVEQVGIFTVLSNYFGLT